MVVAREVEVEVEEERGGTEAGRGGWGRRGKKEVVVDGDGVGWRGGWVDGLGFGIVFKVRRCRE